MKTKKPEISPLTCKLHFSPLRLATSEESLLSGHQGESHESRKHDIEHDLGDKLSDDNFYVACERMQTIVENPQLADHVGHY